MAARSRTVRESTTKKTEEDRKTSVGLTARPSACLPVRPSYRLHAPRPSCLISFNLPILQIDFEISGRVVVWFSVDWLWVVASKSSGVWASPIGCPCLSVLVDNLTQPLYQRSLLLCITVGRPGGSPDRLRRSLWIGVARRGTIIARFYSPSVKK